MRYVAPLFLSLTAAACAQGNLILKRPDSSIISQYTAPIGQADYFLNGDSICVGNTHVSFRHDVLSPISSTPPLSADGLAELYLFSRDPLTTVDLLAALSDDQIKQGQWDAIAAQPVGIPSVMLVQYPTQVGDSTTTPIELDLTQGMFWGAGVDPAIGAEVMCVPFGSSESVPEGRLATAIVYQRGLCSYDVDMADVMGQFFDTFFNQFKATVPLNSSDASAHALYGRMITLIDHIGPSPFGGFQMSFHFTYTHAALGGDVWGTYRFQFTFPGPSVWPAPVRSVPGGLGLNVSEVAIHSSGGYSSFVQDDVQNGLANSSEAFRAALATQTVVPTEFRSCARVFDCQQSATDLGNAITLDKLRAAGMPNATPTDVSHLRCTVGDIAECENIHFSWLGGLVFRNRWQCLPTSNENPDLICKYTLAPARFNVSPDRLNLVWFDKPDLDNPSYALFVAFGANSPFVAGMCASHPSNNAAAAIHHGFSTIVVDNR